MTLDLEELERLEREATPGKWQDGTATCCPDMGWVDGPRGKGRVCPTHEGGKRTHTLDAADAALIAAARNALPALLARVRELEAERDRYAKLHSEAEAQIECRSAMAAELRALREVAEAAEHYRDMRWLDDATPLYAMNALEAKLKAWRGLR